MLLTAVRHFANFTMVVHSRSALIRFVWTNSFWQMDFSLGHPGWSTFFVIEICIRGLYGPVFSGPGTAWTHFSFTGPIRWKYDLSSAGLSRPVGKITSHLSARPGLLEKSSLICRPVPSRPTRVLGPARARAYRYHNILWDPVHEKLKL